MQIIIYFLPARDGSVCLSVCVCLPQVGVLSKGMNTLIWFLAWMLFSTSHTLCFKEIQLSTEIRVLTSGTHLSGGQLVGQLVAWHSGRTSVSGRRTFPVLRSTCS